MPSNPQDRVTGAGTDIAGSTFNPPASGELEERVIALLCRVLNCQLTGVTAESRLFEDLGIDSTGVLELLLAVEEDFDVQFDPEDLEQTHFATVGSFTAWIRASR